MPSPELATMPRPQWSGMRPKRTCPTGVMYSPQARLTAMELVHEFTPAVGGPCVDERKPIGAYAFTPADMYPYFCATVVEVTGCIAYESGVEPRTRLSSRSSCVRMRRLSEIAISGLRRRRRLAPD